MVVEVVQEEGAEVADLEVGDEVEDEDFEEICLREDRELGRVQVRFCSGFKVKIVGRAGVWKCQLAEYEWG